MGLIRESYINNTSCGFGLLPSSIFSFFYFQQTDRRADMPDMGKPCNEMDLHFPLETSSNGENGKENDGEFLSKPIT